MILKYILTLLMINMCAPGETNNKPADVTDVAMNHTTVASNDNPTAVQSARDNDTHTFIPFNTKYNLILFTSILQQSLQSLQSEVQDQLEYSQAILHSLLDSNDPNCQAQIEAAQQNVETLTSNHSQLECALTHIDDVADQLFQFINSTAHLLTANFQYTTADNQKHNVDYKTTARSLHFFPLILDKTDLELSLVYEQGQYAIQISNGDKQNREYPITDITSYFTPINTDKIIDTAHTNMYALSTFWGKLILQIMTN